MDEHFLIINVLFKSKKMLKSTIFQCDCIDKTLNGINNKKGLIWNDIENLRNEKLFIIGIFRIKFRKMFYIEY